MAPRLYANPFVKDAPTVSRVRSEPMPHHPSTHLSFTADKGTCVDKLERTVYSDGSEIVDTVESRPLSDIVFGRYLSMIAQARHPGAGSGCQGCDPEVKIPVSDDPIFLCALCLAWLQMHFAGQPNDISHIVARREALKEQEPAV